MTRRAAIVTGAGGGIGRAIALRLARAGVAIAVNDIDTATACATVDAIRRNGGSAESVVADIADEASVKHLVDQTVARFGGLDFLVNNAGISPKPANGRSPITSLGLAEWNSVMAVNLTGPFMLIRECVEHITARRGRIVNIASVMGKLGSSGPDGVRYGPVSPSGIHYCVSKAALICLTKSVARELAPTGVTCNAVAPGVVASGMASELVIGPILEQVPLGRRATPDEIAGAVMYLLSDDAGYITGEVLDVNGGWDMD